MYRYILGAAGSGKTEYICRTLNEEARKHPYTRYFLFVPEQNTLKAQQQLTAHAASGGILNLDVLSFQLLAYRVLEELGIQAPDLLDDMSRSMLIRRAVLDVAGELKAYRNIIDSKGFTDQISSLITEFYQYGVDEEKLKAVQEETGGELLKAKLHDAILIYGRFRHYLTEGTTIPEELPVILRDHMAASSLPDGAVVVFDGFTGFTPIQMDIIGRMFEKAAHISFAFTIPEEAEPFKRDPGPEGISDLFWLVKENIYRLDMLAAANGLKAEPPVYLKGNFGPEKVILLTAPDPVKEVRTVAECIRRDCLRQEDPLRFRDVAVAVPSMEEYRELLRREFARAGIPCFMDENADGFGTSVVRFIRSALEVLAQNWKADAVMSFFRNPLCIRGEEREQLDNGENLVRARGIRSRKAFLRLAEEGVLPREPLTALSRLQEAFGKAAGNSGKTEALRAFLEEMQLEERLETFAGRLLEAGENERAADERTFYAHTMALLERIERLFGNQKTGVRDYIRILESGFSDLKAGKLPRTLDSVTVGDLKRSRFDGISALYILDASEGSIPAAVSGGGIFTDAERDEMMRLHLELAPDDRQDASIRSYYLYILMNKPRRTLCLSRAAEDRKGRPRSPSPVLEELEEYLRPMPSELVRRSLKPGDPALGGLKNRLSSFAAMLGEEKKDEAQMLELYQHLRQQPEGAEALRQLLAAAFLGHHSDRLSVKAAEELYGDVIYGSVSRIESYERCPYSYFLNYGLGLRERESYDVEAVDLGNLYHDVLDMLFTQLRTEGRDITRIADGELLELTEKHLQRAADAYNDNILESSARNRYIREVLRRTMQRTVLTLKAQLAAGSFEAAKTEYAFRAEKEHMAMEGRIDRLDIFEKDGRRYIRVVDYKSGSTAFSPALIAGGLQLQLSAYLDEAMKDEAAKHPGTEIVPGGMLYYSIQDPPLLYSPGSSEEEQREELLHALRMDGLCLEEKEALLVHDRRLDPETEDQVSSLAVPVDIAKGKLSRTSSVTDREGFENLILFVRNRIEQDVTKIRSGDIRIRPYRHGNMDACGFCPYREVCGFDERSRDYGYREIPRKNRQEFLKELRGEA